ncbi:MAG: nucleotidyltransferase domain-containing protein [Promethearchaeota archaeon]
MNDIKIQSKENKYPEKDKEIGVFIDYLKNFFQKEFIEDDIIESIILFGSYAVGNYSKNSDLDICILFKPNTNREYEVKIHEKILNLSKKIDKIIECIYIYPESLNKWDDDLIKSILSDGIRLFGSDKYKKIFFDKIKFVPYYIVKYNLKNLNPLEKAKLLRILYGYESTKDYNNKKYRYKKKGLLQQLKGFPIGKGVFLIPSGNFYKIAELFEKFEINYQKINIWI